MEEKRLTDAEADVLRDIRDVKRHGFGKILVTIQSNEVVAVDVTPHKKYGKGEVRLP